MQKREPHEWYVDESFCTHQLIEAEQFDGTVWDPCCGSGTIPRVFREHGLPVVGSDLVDRGYEDYAKIDFLGCESAMFGARTIVCNFPYAEFIMPMLEHARRLVPTVCALVPMNFLNSAKRGHYFRLKPPARIWILSNRPSMPPGSRLQDGSIRQGGGTTDYCWIVFERGHNAPPVIDWLVWSRDRIEAARQADRNIWQARRAAA